MDNKIFQEILNLVKNPARKQLATDNAIAATAEWLIDNLGKYGAWQTEGTQPSLVLNQPLMDWHKAVTEQLGQKMAGFSDDGVLFQGHYFSSINGQGEFFSKVAEQTGTEIMPANNIAVFFSPIEVAVNREDKLTGMVGGNFKVLHNEIAPERVGKFLCHPEYITDENKDSFVTWQQFTNYQIEVFLKAILEAENQAELQKTETEESINYELV